MDDPPVANLDVRTAQEDAPEIIIDVITNDTDIDNTNTDLTLVGAAAPLSTLGAAVFASGGRTLSYTPNPDAFGTDIFNYVVQDSDGKTAIETVTIIIEPVLDFPVTLNDIVQIPEDTLFTIDVLDNDTDVDSPKTSLTIDPLSVIYRGPGTRELSSDNKSFIYKTKLHSTLPDSFKYKIKDGDGLISTEARVHISVISLHDAPEAVNDGFGPLHAIEVNEDEPTGILINVLENDSDPDGDTPLNLRIGVDLTNHPSIGKVTVETEPGTLKDRIRYIPDPGQFGRDQFRYTLIDNQGGTATALVRVNVLPVNDPPNPLSQEIITFEDKAVTTVVVSRDPEADAVSTNGPWDKLTSKGGRVVNDFDGTFSYFPKKDFYGVTFSHTR